MSYFYIYDPRGDKQIKYFERIQGRLSNLFAESRIDGESYRVTAIRTVDLLVEQAVGADAKTLIVVGSDQTLNQAVNSLVRRGLQDHLILGYIPLENASPLAQIFGIPFDPESAVRTLAGRLVHQLDLGKVGEHFFLSSVNLGPSQFLRTEPGPFGLSAARKMMNLVPFVVKLSIEDSYTATSEVLSAQVVNTRSNEGCRLRLGDPTDQFLDVLLLNKLSSSQLFRYRRELASGCIDNVPGSTVMHARKVSVLGPKKLPLSIEGQTYTKAPAVIQVAQEKVSMIVGKGRQF